jgi:hypothetical protein
MTYILPRGSTHPLEPPPVSLIDPSVGHARRSAVRHLRVALRLPVLPSRIDFHESGRPCAEGDPPFRELAGRHTRSGATRSRTGAWRDYGETIWGLTACDGPIDATLEVDGRPRTFHTYWARGVAPGDRRDDGTLAPTAAIASLPFAPEIVLPAVAEIHRRYGEKIFSRYGFFDAFNPTFRLGVPLRHGRVIEGLGWVDGDYLGIDQGPIVAMIENYRTGLVW